MISSEWAIFYFPQESMEYGIYFKHYSTFEIIFTICTVK